MKHIFTSFTAFAILGITMLSCRKEEHERENRQIETSQVVTATVKTGQTYVLNLEAGSTANISKQASHYTVSEVTATPDGNAVYHYAAAKGYTGADEVSLRQTIQTTSSGGGCSDHHSGSHTTTFKTIVLKLDVAN